MNDTNEAFGSLTGGRSVVVTPGPAAKGLADILVALGEAGIDVNRAERHPEFPGSYVVILPGDADL